MRAKPAPAKLLSPQLSREQNQTLQHPTSLAGAAAFVLFSMVVSGWNVGELSEAEAAAWFVTVQSVFTCTKTLLPAAGGVVARSIEQ